MDKDIWFYCKVDILLCKHLSNWYSYKDDNLYPMLDIDSEWIAVYKDGETEDIHVILSDSVVHTRLRLDIAKKSIYIPTRNMFCKGRTSFKIQEYTSDLEECYSPKSVGLLAEYKNIKKKITEAYLKRKGKNYEQRR